MNKEEKLAFLEKILEEADIYYDKSTFSEHTPLFDYQSGDLPGIELDSLDTLEVITLIEDTLRISFPDEIDIEDFRTVNDLMELF